MSSKQALYLNLLFKSLKSDNNTARVKAFIKRIVHITSMHSPGFICGVLFLLAELTTSRPDLKSLWSTTSQISEYDARKRDPLYASAFVANMGSLGLDAPFHHLYEYGGISIFAGFGGVKNEVVVRNNLDVAKFLERIKNDTSFYKAFRTLHILGFTSLNDIRSEPQRGELNHMFTK